MRRAIADMQSLFSCLFALLLYAGGIYTVMCITARLLWITQQENTAREENTDAIEIMQVWEVDSAVNEDVRGMRATAAVETHDI
ncbi:hypothetical protein WMO38_02665 [Lachnospira sp. CLA-JM-H10]|uniref:Uncharacterized protein n=1 Tax=Lachnospira intestinalis TaxID=3133158 RepID=A0ABV1GKQ1_9FIRM